MTFDELLIEIGEFGPYQKRVFLLASFVCVLSGTQTMSAVFLMDIPDYRCALPHDVYHNDTFAIQNEHHRMLINMSIPAREYNGERTLSKCQLYNVSERSLGHANNTTQVECSSWVYDKSILQSTGITDFNLVCKNEIQRSHSNMIGFLGSFVGSFTLGPLSDIFGRKKTLLLAVFINLISQVAGTFAPNFTVFVCMTFLRGVAQMGLFMVAFVIGVEFVGPSKRVFVGVVVNFFWVAGLFFLTGVAYIIREWRHLMLAISAPSVVYIAYWWVMPESPRWLMSKGRREEALEIIQKIAASNKVELDEEMLSKCLVDDEEASVPFWHMFASPVLLLRTAILIFNWYAINTSYYGMSLNVGNLTGDIYLNFFLSSVMEVLGYIVTWVFLGRAGRRPLLSACMIIAGVAGLATVFPVMFGDKSTQWILTALAMLGKLFCSAAFAVVYIFTTELFPTVLRQSGLGFCSIFEGIGGMTAPYIADLGILVKGEMAEALPLIVFGSLSIAAGFLAILLPETMNQVLPETVNDTVLFGKKPKDDIMHMHHIEEKHKGKHL